MPKLKYVTPSQSIKNGSFEAWVLVVVSTIKAAGAESTLPAYMYPGGVNVSTARSSFSNKLKEKGKEKSEDDDESDPPHQTLLSTIILIWTDPESDWILFSNIPPNDPYIGTKRIDSVMKKYKKKGSQPVQKFRSEMDAKQRDGETCVDVWQRIKMNAQGLRSACRTIETMYLADALKGSLHPEHVHWMITIDTSSVTLDELEDKVLTMGQHADQVLSNGSSSHSSTFMSATSPKDIDIKLDNVTTQLSNQYASLLSSRSGSFNITEGEGRGRGGGRSSGGRGKINNSAGNVGGRVIASYSVLELY